VSDLLLAQLVKQIAERAAELALERLHEEARASRWMSVLDAAGYARCSPQHIYDLRSDGRLGKHGERGHALVDRYELDAYLEKRRGR
jgi:excisionase family DNA binding protein